MRNILIALIFYGILLLPSCNANQGNSNSIDTGTDTNTPIENLKNWLAKPVGERESLESLDFSKQHLTKKQWGPGLSRPGPFFGEFVLGKLLCVC